MQAPARPRRAPSLRHLLRPGYSALRRLVGLPSPDILEAAQDRWVLAEGTPLEVRKAKCLPGQLDRITGSDSGTVQQVIRDFIGGFESPQLPTIAFQLRDIALVGGVLYSGTAFRQLRHSAPRLTASLKQNVTPDAALYESWLGNRNFGAWLSDDCLTYRLAEFYGHPVATQAATGQKSEYERKLGMAAARLPDTWFAELTLFDDTSHNDNKRFRATDLRRRLIGDEPTRHSGVFLLTGSTGACRELANERAVAEQLVKKRGFRVIDPSTASLPEILEACAGAQVVAGVEGSYLTHGLMVMPPEARLLVIQPPTKAGSALKMITDRQGQDYSLVIGSKGRGGSVFTADFHEIERTLDLP